MGPELPAPPPLLPGPKAGSASEAGTITDVAATASAASVPAARVRVFVMPLHLRRPHPMGALCAPPTLRPDATGNQVATGDCCARTAISSSVFGSPFRLGRATGNDSPSIVIVPPFDV